MKKLALAAALTVAASTAFAGGVVEPVMEPEVVEAATSSSAGGIIVPLLLLLVIAAAASQCPVKLLQKGLVSRTYGKRNVDEYVADDAFWMKNTTGGNLRKLSRETTMLLISERNG